MKTKLSFITTVIILSGTVGLLNASFLKTVAEMGAGAMLHAGYSTLTGSKTEIINLNLNDIIKVNGNGANDDSVIRVGGFRASGKITDVTITRDISANGNQANKGSIIEVGEVSLGQ